MKEYWAHFSGWFETNEKEVLKLKRYGHFSMETFSKNLLKLKKYFDGEKRNHERLEIIDYTIREVPEKKNKYDNAVLLCVKLSNGEFLAKRFHNSQWLSLDY